MLTTLGANVFVTGAPEFIDETINVPYISFEQAIKHCDVLMLLRIQHERHNESFDISAYHKQYGLTIQREKSMKQNAIILHPRSEEHTSELQSRGHLVCRLLLEKKKKHTPDSSTRYRHT